MTFLKLLPPDLAILNELLALLLQDKRTLFLVPGKREALFETNSHCAQSSVYICDNKKMQYRTI